MDILAPTAGETFTKDQIKAGLAVCLKFGSTTVWLTGDEADELAKQLYNLGYSYDSDGV